jgi:hypothetical protein
MSFSRPEQNPDDPIIKVMEISNPATSQGRGNREDPTEKTEEQFN